MPIREKALHLDVFSLYMEMGGLSKEFVAEVGRKFGKSDRTLRRWEKDLNWKERAKQPIQEAVEELEESGKLNAEELIGGLLDLCQNRMKGLSTKSTYMDAIFGTVFDRIPSEENPEPENPIQIGSISELKELVLAQSRLVRDEQAYMRLVLTLVGKPETIMEERMIVEFAGLPEDFFDDSSSDDDAADVQAGG